MRNDQPEPFEYLKKKESRAIEATIQMLKQLNGIMIKHSTAFKAWRDGIILYQQKINSGVTIFNEKKLLLVVRRKSTVSINISIMSYQDPRVAAIGIFKEVSNNIIKKSIRDQESKKSGKPPSLHPSEGTSVTATIILLGSLAL